MGQLYIIGNGLDLHFGLHTLTSDFQNFLMTKQVFGQLDNALDYFSIYGVDWSDFEHSLSEIDFETIDEENEQYPDYLSTIYTAEDVAPYTSQNGALSPSRS